jgi:hypothetical protein
MSNLSPTAAVMTTLTTAWMLGCVCGFFLGVTVASRRRPTCRELMRDRQPSFAELLMPPPRDRDPDWRRSINHENTNGGPCTSGPSHCDCGALWLDLPSAKAIADKSWAEARRATFIDPSLAAGPPRLSH